MAVPWDEAAKRVMPFKLMDTRRAARIILTGVARNQAIIVFPAHARLLWWLSRINLALLEPVGKRMVKVARQMYAPRS